jgi:hypothetical protein
VTSPIDSHTKAQRPGGTVSTCRAGDLVLANPPPYLEQPWMGAGIPLISAILAEAGITCRIVRLLESDTPTPAPIQMACDRTRWISRTLDERLAGIRALATQHRDFFEAMLAILLAGPETIFGFTTWRHNSDVVLELARQLKERRPGCVILLGGPEAAEAPFNLYDEHVDVIVGGRAEALAPMAVRALQEGHPEELAPFEGVWVNPRFQPRVHLTKQTPELPPIPRIDYARIVPVLLHPRHTIIPVVLNVGCPFSCGFCANKSVYPEMEWSTPKRLFEEIDQIVSRWEELTSGTPDRSLELFLCDATVNAQPAQFDELCEMIAAAPWPTRPRLSGAFIVDGRITPERVKLFTDAGCSSFFFGLESASPRVRKEMKKPGTLDAVAQGLLNIRDHGQGRFRVNVGVFVGWPSETEEDYHATVAFVEWIASLGIVGEVSLSPLYRAVGPMNPGIFDGAEGMGYTWRMNGPAGSPAVRFRRFIGLYEHFARLESSMKVVTSVVPRQLVELMLPDAPVAFYDAWAAAHTRTPPLADESASGPAMGPPSGVAQGEPRAPSQMQMRALAAADLRVGRQLGAWALRSITPRDGAAALVLEFERQAGAQIMAVELGPRSDAPAFKRTELFDVRYLRMFDNRPCASDAALLEQLLSLLVAFERREHGGTHAAR